MATELLVLTLAALLQAVQLMIAASLKNGQLGPNFNMSPRDEASPPLTGTAGRADRALKNHYESLPLFAVAVLVLVLADKTSGLSAGLAWVYLAARTLYVPAYLLGWSPWRSLIWFAAFLSTLALLIMALF